MSRIMDHPGASPSSASRPDDVVGHKTLRNGSHVPLMRAEADALLAMCDAEDARRAEAMPDVQAALRAFHDAYQRLGQLGWRDALYCPRDGTEFEVIEPGSTGIHRCVWMSGSHWIRADGDLWPSRPALFRLLPHGPQGQEKAAPTTLSDPASKSPHTGEA